MPRNTTLVTWSSRYKVNVFSFWQESAASGLSLISLKFVSTRLQSTWFSSHRSKRSLHDIPPHILKFKKGNLPAVFLRVSILALGCFSKNVAMAIAFSLCFLLFGRMGIFRGMDHFSGLQPAWSWAWIINQENVAALGSIWNCIRHWWSNFNSASHAIVSKQTHRKCLQQNHKFHERVVSDLTSFMEDIALASSKPTGHIDRSVFCFFYGKRLWLHDLGSLIRKNCPLHHSSFFPWLPTHLHLILKCMVLPQKHSKTHFWDSWTSLVESRGVSKLSEW